MTATAVDTPAPERSGSRRLPRDGVTIVAALGLLVLVVAGIGAGLFVHPNVQRLDQAFLAPGSGHLLGTDELGRDVLARILAGAKTTLGIALAALAINLVVGVLVGGVAGLLGGAIGGLLMRIGDAIYALPGMLIALVIVFALGPSAKTVILALCIEGWLVHARLVEGITSSLRHQGFIEFARLSGIGSATILRTHIFPNLWRPVMTVAVMEFARLALAEASLSFLGMGIQSPQVSLGMLLEDGAANMSFAWWIVTFPGLYLMLVILCGNLVASNLRKAARG